MTGRELILYVPPCRKRGRPTDYDPAFCERVVEYGRDGMCREEIAAALDVSYPTFSNWLKVYPDFLYAATRAKELEYAYFLRAGREGMLNRHFNVQAWALQMRNRFGDRFRIRDAEPGDAPAGEETKAIRHDMERKLARIAAAGSAESASLKPNARSL